jgi:hypothetical protein
MSRRDVLLIIPSLLSILLATLHLADDIVRGFEPGGFKNVSGLSARALWSLPWRRQP